MAIDILVIIICLFANALFVAAEFAFVKVRRSQIEILARKRNYFAEAAKDVIENLDFYLSLTQLGTTVSSLALGWFGANLLADYAFGIISSYNYPISFEWLKFISLLTTFLLITFLHIIFGGLVPKAAAMQYPEGISIALALPIKALSWVLRPFVWLINQLANLVVKIISIEKYEPIESIPSSDELRILIDESSKSGMIDSEDSKLLENVFDFVETPVKQIMVPRMKISAIDINDTFDEIVAIFIEDGYSRMPIFDGSIDNIIGEVYSKDLLNMVANKTLISFSDIIRPAFFINEDDKIQKVLKAMQKEHHHLAIVMNEFGGVAGLITMEDIIEELVGEIQDEYDEESPLAEETSANEFEIDASITINDINEILPEPLPESDDYETLGGYITNNISRIPQKGESFVINKFAFTIIDSTDRKINAVKLKFLIDKVVDKTDD